jgi:hypothetical protein
MAHAPFLFPSRFPAADYKAAVAIGMIIIAADSWTAIFAHHHRPLLRTVIAALLLMFGVLVAPSHFAHPTREVWLVIAVIAATGSLVLFRLRVHNLVFVALLGLVVVDGVREIHDLRLGGTTPPWEASPAALSPFVARDHFVASLPERLEHPPTSRPSRIPPAVAIARAPLGNYTDTAGWVANGYHVVDYGGTIEGPLWQAEHDPALQAKLLLPWRAYLLSCRRIRCSNVLSDHLPPPTRWRPTTRVQTLQYGVDHIIYSVNVPQPELMVENELAIAGWSSSSRKATLVRTELPFRAWRLSRGNYRFTAAYHQPGGTAQYILLLMTLLSWSGCLGTMALLHTRAKRST